MKQTLLVLILSIITINGITQSYHPIVKESNNWSVVSGGLGAILKVCCASTDHYKFEGDTTIQLNDYKKIISTNDSINQSWEMIGFIREDTTQKKVWIRDIENQEGLVYDFDVTLGEVLTLYNPLFMTTNICEVVQIDSVLIKSEYRKTIVLDFGGWEEKWTEGIGSEYGIVGSNIFGVTGGFKELLCFSDDNYQYINPKFETCHKTYFTPRITNQTIDNAIINQEYHYQITTSEIFDYDSIIYFLSGSWLPNGLTLNRATGLISGVPTERGSFHLFLCVGNNGYVTDYFETDLVVFDHTSINTINWQNQITIYPNPAEEEIIIDLKNNSLNCRIVVSDLSGRQLVLSSINNIHYKLNIENLAKGNYLISVYNEGTGEKMMTRKLIIE